MSDDLPFDPQPRPDEIERVLHRVHRRRALRAGGSGAAVVAGLVAVVLTFGGTSTQVLLQEDVPIGPATGASPTPRPVALPTGAALPTALPAAPDAGAATPSPAAGSVPVLGPRPAPTPRPDDQATQGPRPAPPQQRPAYAGQIGPGYAQYEATDCVVTNRSTSDAVIRNDYCIYFIGAGSKDSWRPSIRICRVYDSTSPGRLTFPGGEEADFALYRGTQGPDGRPVTGELLFRFSDTVRYDSGAHGRDVAPGDCWTWRLNLPIDFEAYPADAGFVGEWRTTVEQYPASERSRRTHFTAGAFHGDNAP